MGIFKLLAVGALCAVFSFAAPAAIVTTAAGSGHGGNCAIGNGAAIIPAADIYLAGSNNGYKLDPGGAMNTVIDTSGYAAEPGDGKSATQARLRGTSAIAVDANGVLYSADIGQPCSRPPQGSFGDVDRRHFQVRRGSARLTSF